jgi:HD superfamily phosphohydrolase
VPKWGLTAEQIEAEPWGIRADLLRPAKTITDPVHGDVHVNRLESMFLDSPPMQRLRRVRQLGTAHLVYPGATHSRFSHALGAVRAAQDLLDAVIDGRQGPRPHDDLLAEWDARVDPGESVSDFDRRLAEVTVLARVGALLHDLCHVPFGHTIEDDLTILTPHDENPERFRRLWEQLQEPLAQALKRADPRFMAHVEPLIISKIASKTEDDSKGSGLPAEYEYPFVADIVGNTICADLIDYLARDHTYTGLPMALGHRFANEFYVNRSDAPHFPSRMVIQVTRNRHERPDVVTELLKYLRYRYELSERVLYHHAKLAADAMIGKLLELWHDHEWARRLLKRRPELADLAGDMTALRGRVRMSTAKALDAKVELHMEEQFTRRGDDGLLEYLVDLAESDESSDGRLEGVGELARAVLSRRLFKLAGRADDDADRGLAGEIHSQFGNRDNRRRLEQSAARFIGASDGWKVVLWIPSPAMKLKVAGVLVNRNGTVNALDKVGYERANEIYSAHQKLWGVNVYVPQDVVEDQVKTRRLLAFLGATIGVRFRDGEGEPVGGPATVAARELADERNLTVARTREFVEMVERRHIGIAAHGSEESATFVELRQRVEQLADAEGFKRRSRRR